MKRLNFKKNTFILFLVVVLMSSTTVFTRAAGAPKGSSTATIVFTVGTGTEDVNIVDPDNPTTIPSSPTPITPGNNFVFIYASDFTFAPAQIPSGPKVYKSTELNPFVQMLDTTGSNDGWKIKTKLGQFEKSDAVGVNSLVGAKLVLKGGTTASNDSTADGGKAPTVTSTEITLTSAAADPTKIVYADVNKGGGTWIANWKKLGTDTGTTNSNVYLDIPASSVSIGTHTATLLWTLETGPT